MAFLGDFGKLIKKIAVPALSIVGTVVPGVGQVATAISGAGQKVAQTSAAIAQPPVNVTVQPPAPISGAPAETSLPWKWILIAGGAVGAFFLLFRLSRK